MKQEEITGKIIGAYYAVYRELGHGFLESVYQNAMALEMRTNGLEVSREYRTKVSYRGAIIGDFFADLVVNNTVLVELKACSALNKAHEAQVINYLRATPIEVALLFNFGPKQEMKRLLLDNEKKTVRVFPCLSVAGPHSS